jgi:hypothetical protein
MRGLVEIARALRRYPWMVEVVKQRRVSDFHPYTVEAYVAVDGSEACLSLTPPKAYCARDGAARETRLELEFKQYEVYEENKRSAPPQGAIGIHHRGQGIREDALAAFFSKFYFCV